MDYRDVETEKDLALELFGIVEAGYNLKKLNLSNRTYNCLVRSGIVEIKQLIVMNEKELNSIKFMNKKSLEEIEKKVTLFLNDNPEYTFLIENSKK